MFLNDEIRQNEIEKYIRKSDIKNQQRLKFCLFDKNALVSWVSLSCFA